MKSFKKINEFEYSNGVLTLIFEKIENSEKYSFHIKNEEELNKKLFETVFTKAVQKEIKRTSIFFAAKGIFEYIHSMDTDYSKEENPGYFLEKFNIFFQKKTGSSPNFILGEEKDHVVCFVLADKESFDSIGEVINDDDFIEGQDYFFATAHNYKLAKMRAAKKYLDLIQESI